MTGTIFAAMTVTIKEPYSNGLVHEPVPGPLRRVRSDAESGVRLGSIGRSARCVKPAIEVEEHLVDDRNLEYLPTHFFIFFVGRQNQNEQKLCPCDG